MDPKETINVFNNITTQYLNTIKPWMASVFTHANYIMAMLAILQIVILFAFLALKGNTLEGIIAKIIKQIIVIGFFYALVLNAGKWLPAIINSFSLIGASAGNLKTLDPSSVFDQGMTMAGFVLAAASKMGFISHPFGALMAVVITCAIVFAYIMICADLVITLVLAYIIIAVSPLFFAFGVNDLTKPMAKNIINTSIGIGLKLMALYVIIGIGMSLGPAWYRILTHAATGEKYYLAYFAVAGAVLVFYMLAKNIPPQIAALAGCGSLMSHGGEMIGAATAGAAAGAAMTGSAHNRITGTAAFVDGASKTAAGGGAQSVFGAAQKITGGATGLAGKITGNQGLKDKGKSLSEAGAANITKGAEKSAEHRAKAASGAAKAFSGKKF